MTSQTTPVRSLAWTNVQGAGSAEHYWHFLFGYLLPVVDWLSLQHDQDRSLKLFDCGPTMNEVARDALQEPWQIAPVFDDAEIEEASLVEALSRSSPADTHSRIKIPRWDLWLTRGPDPDGTACAIRKAGDALKRALIGRACCSADAVCGHYLVLRRSDEPSYYRKDGPARIPTYGVGRRTLVGLEEGSAELHALGVPNSVYEPGGHNLACQIEHFSRCSGVIGVRGAEFANTLWMPQTGKVVLLHSAWFKDDDPPPRTLSRALGHSAFMELSHNGVENPMLDAKRVAEALRAS